MSEKGGFGREQSHANGEITHSRIGARSTTLGNPVHPRETTSSGNVHFWAPGPLGLLGFSTRDFFLSRDLSSRESLSCAFFESRDISVFSRDIFYRATSFSSRDLNARFFSIASPQTLSQAAQAQGAHGPKSVRPPRMWSVSRGCMPHPERPTRSGACSCSSFRSSPFSVAGLSSSSGATSSSSASSLAADAAG